MPTYEYKGQPVEQKNGWVSVADNRMKLSQALKLKDFVEIPDPQPPEPSEEEKAALFEDEVKREVAKRILAVVNTAAQMNLLAAAEAGFLTEDQTEIFKAGVTWIGAIRADGRRITSEQIENYYEDEHWTEVPPGVAELAGEF